MITSDTESSLCPAENTTPEFFEKIHYLMAYNTVIRKKNLNFVPPKRKRNFKVHYLRKPSIEIIIETTFF